MINRLPLNVFGLILGLSSCEVSKKFQPTCWKKLSIVLTLLLNCFVSMRRSIQDICSLLIGFLYEFLVRERRTVGEYCRVSSSNDCVEKPSSMLDSETFFDVWRCFSFLLNIFFWSIYASWPSLLSIQNSHIRNSITPMMLLSWFRKRSLRLLNLFWTFVLVLCQKPRDFLRNGALFLGYLSEIGVVYQKAFLPWTISNHLSTQINMKFRGPGQIWLTIGLLSPTVICP